MTQSTKSRWWLYLILSVAVLAVAAPFFWMILGSFKSTTELRQSPPTWWPESPSLDNYRQLFSKASFGTYFMNSTIVAVVVTAGNLLFCSMVGYALAMLDFPGRNVLFAVIMGTLLIPGMVTFVPQFVLAANVGLTSRPFDSANPQLDLRLPDGSRLSAVMGVCQRPSLSIRRSRLGQVSLEDLHATGTFSEDVMHFLKAAVAARKNIMIAGATNSGKTTMLRAFAAEIPPHERLVRGVDEDHAGPPAALPQGLQRDRQLGGEVTAAHVDDGGDLLPLRVVGGDLHELDDHRGRQVVDDVPATVLEDVGGRRAAGPAHPRDDDEVGGPGHRGRRPRRLGAALSDRPIHRHGRLLRRRRPLRSRG